MLEQRNRWAKTRCLNQFDFVFGIDSDVGKSAGSLAHNFFVGTAKQSNERAQASILFNLNIVLWIDTEIAK